MSAPPGTTKDGTPFQRRLTIHLRRTGKAEMGVRAQIGGVAEERSIRLGNDFNFSYDTFLNTRLPDTRYGAKTTSFELDSKLHQLGDAVGKVLFSDGIERSFINLLNAAAAANETVDVIVETEDPQLLTIPFEAARLSNGRVPALESGVRMARRLVKHQFHAQTPMPGPLKILAAVGAPDEGSTGNAVLDPERELQSILDAVKEARLHGDVYVRILEVGSLEQITSSLQEQPYHILHLSGHGSAGHIELEDEDGKPMPATAADLADALRVSKHPPPLVFLASCLSGAGANETISLSQGLLERGVQMTVAMQTSVTDTYATQLAASFYTKLATGNHPLASDALAEARQQVERRRLKELARGNRTAPEYATPSLCYSGEETPILDRSRALDPPVERPRKLSTGAVPMLSIGDLVGRRVELRQVMQVLTDDNRSISKIGYKAGCQIRGIGGVGKSSLTGRVMGRLAEKGWTCVAISGRWTLSEMATSLSAALYPGGTREVRDTARALAEKEIPDDVRLKLITALLSQHNILLVLDNFEDNLTKEDRFLNPAAADVMQQLYTSAQRGKILITSRYPVPGAAGWLESIELGELSPPQTDKLMLRLEGLRGLDPESLHLIRRAIGGHPRMLEYLDAILRQGKARVPEVERRLKEQARREGINLADASITLDSAVSAALQVGAGDILLDELLELVWKHERDLETLYQASVFPHPVSVDGLAFCIAGGHAPSRMQINETRLVAERVSKTSLLTHTSDDKVWVHRWTAEVLRSRVETGSSRVATTDFRAYCRLAAEYIISRRTSLLKTLETLEAIRLFIAAHEIDRAAEEGNNLIPLLERYGQAADLSAVARELARALPANHTSHDLFLTAEIDALQLLGFWSEALKKQEALTESLEKLVEAHPETKNHLRKLSDSYGRMGGHLRGLSQGEKARDYLLKSLKIEEQLTGQETDLPGSYERMSDLLHSLGQGEEAIGYLRKSLDIRRRLMDAEPQRADFRSDLASSYVQMGELLRDLGKHEQAREYLQKSLDIRKPLVEQEPKQPGVLRDLAVSYERLGGLLHYLGLGKSEEARDFLQKSVDIRQRLVDEEQGRADFLWDLSSSQESMSDLLRDLDRGTQALVYLERSVDVRKLLFSRDPGRDDFLRGLSVSYARMGDLLRDLGQGEQARPYLVESLDLAKQLVGRQPDRPDFKRDLSVSYERMGDLLRDLREQKEARGYFQRSLDIRNRLIEEEPNRADSQRDLSVSYERMGDLLRDLREHEEARSYFQRSLDIRNRLVEQRPDRPDFLRDLAISFERMGDLLPDFQQRVAAIEYYQKSLDIRKRLVGREPDRADFLRDLSATYRQIGNLMRDIGDDEEARQYLQKSFQINDRLVGREPDRADFKFDRAMLLHDMRDCESMRRALDILQQLDREHKLPSKQLHWVPSLESAISASCGGQVSVKDFAPS
jgi:tetratricopeptide (TPR) repeat protein